MRDNFSTVKNDLEKNLKNKTYDFNELDLNHRTLEK